MTPDPTAAPVAGTWLHNPVTGEIAHLDTVEDGGRRIEFELWLQPGAALARAHIHDHAIERFTVREGEVGFQIAGREHVTRAGDATVEIPSGALHDWWNAGDGVTRVRVEVLTADGAPGRPPARVLAMIITAWSLGALGRVNAEGVPGPLWLATIAREYRDAIRVVRPPAVVQSVLFGPLAAIARRTGRDPFGPEVHGPTAAAVIPDPGEDGLARLLAEPVGARAARGRA